MPHSEISGSTGICPSPKLFAACHVLHRLSVPRHPPCALHARSYYGRPSCHSVDRKPHELLLSASPGNGDTADRNFHFCPESSHFCDSSDVFLILCLLRLDVFISQAVYRSHLAPSCAAYRITGARSVGVPPTCLYTSCRTHVNMPRHAV